MGWGSSIFYAYHLEALLLVVVAPREKKHLLFFVPRTERLLADGCGLVDGRNDVLVFFVHPDFIACDHSLGNNLVLL